MDLQYTPLEAPWKSYEYPDGTRSPSIITDGVVYRCAHCNAHWDDPASIPADHGVEKRQLVVRPWKKVTLQNGWPSPCLITDGSKHRCILCGDEYADVNSIPEAHRRSWPEHVYVPLDPLWKWHEWSDGERAATWITDGVTWRCLRCGKGFSQTRSIAGHEASVHTPEERKARQPLIVDELLAYIGEGRWSTVGEIAAMASHVRLRESELRQHLTSLRESKGAHRLLQEGGVPLDVRQQQALEEEGLQFDDRGRADTHKHVTEQDLREELDRLGLVSAIISKSSPGLETQKQWLFQANPDVWDLEVEVPKIGVGNEDTWTASRHGPEMTPGDPVVLWKSGPQAGIYGLAEITRPLTTRPRPEYRKRSETDTSEEPVVYVRYKRLLDEPILRRSLLSHPVLSNLQVIRAPQGTNYTLTAEEWRAVSELVNTSPTPDAPLGKLAAELFLDVSYLRTVKELLEHKRQVIFHGPPGTGKTYVAKKLAELFAEGGGAVEKVQFHPSYAYEDFVEGWRTGATRHSRWPCRIPWSKRWFLSSSTTLNRRCGAVSCRDTGQRRMP